MTKIRTITKAILLSTVIFLIVTSGCNKDEQYYPPIVDNIAYIDGPYVFYENDNIRIVSVNRHNKIEDTIVKSVDSLLVLVPNQDPDHFYVKLKKDNSTFPGTFEKADKLLAISDIEGDYYSFKSLLIGNKVTDTNLNWTFGKGHLVLNGDFVDRGAYVTQVLWLIYKLEQEATAAGGHVHFIIGNHETMNLKGNFKYVLDKYKKLVKELGMEQKDFYNYKSEMGRWLRSKNIIEKIDEILFAHGGISNEILYKKMDIATLNQIARINYGLDLANNTSTIPNLIFGNYGPLWYRGLVKDDAYYSKAETKEVNEFLAYYQSSKIVIGHSVVNDISLDYDGNVIRIDVNHPDNISNKEKSNALFVENNVIYKVDIMGNKIALN